MTSPKTSRAVMSTVNDIRILLTSPDDEKEERLRKFLSPNVGLNDSRSQQYRSLPRSGSSFRDSDPTENSLNSQNRKFIFGSFATGKLKMIGGKRTTSTFERGNVWRRLQWILRQNFRLIVTVLGLLLGIIIGFAGRAAQPSEFALIVIGFPGEILLRLLSMMFIPLLISTLITGMANFNLSSSGKMAYRLAVYYFVTTIMALIVGMILVTAIRPGGKKMSQEAFSSELIRRTISALDIIMDIIRNIFPENLIIACFRQVHTRIVVGAVENVTSLDNRTNISQESIHEGIVTRKMEMSPGTNAMGLIFFSLTFGAILVRMGQHASIMIEFFSIFADIVMVMISCIMWFSPVGIMSLVASNIMAIKDFAWLISHLGLFILTVILGLLIHGAITLPLIYFIMTRQNPWLFYQGVSQAFIMAFSTGTSTGTLPITFYCLENNLLVDHRVTSIVLPIGAICNLDGAALYEAVAAIFISQVHNIYLGPFEIITISVLATLASIGSSSVTGAKLETSAAMFILYVLGIPSKDILLIMAVDWFLDRLRTAVNVLGDSFGAGIIHHLSKDELTSCDRTNLMAALASRQSFQHQEEMYFASPSPPNSRKDTGQSTSIKIPGVKPEMDHFDE